MSAINPEDYKLNANTFLKGIVNLALVVRFYLTNNNQATVDFIDNFVTESLGHGDTKLYISTDLPKVTDYQQDSTLLTNEAITAKEEAISISERKKIHITYNRYFFDLCFTSDSGVTAYISAILSQVESARYKYIYDWLLNTLFTEVYSGTQQIPVNVFAKDASATATERLAINTYNAEIVQIALQENIQNMQVFSPNYNKFSFTQAVSIEDLVCVLNAYYANQNTVSVLATLLNSNVIKESFKMPKILVVPKIKMPADQENTIGFIMHKRHLQIFYKLVVNYAFFDASNMNEQYFAHFHFGGGTLDGLPAIKLIAVET